LARQYPAIGSVVAKYHGPNHPAMPPYVAFMTSRTHVAFGGWLGRQYDPFPGRLAARLPVYDNVGVHPREGRGGERFRVTAGLSQETLYARRELLQAFDSLRADLDTSGAMEAMDRYGQQALELVLGRRVQEAFDLEREPMPVRQRYGRHLWLQ